MELMVLLVAVAELDDHDQVGGGTATTSPLPPNLLRIASSSFATSRDTTSKQRRIVRSVSATTAARVLAPAATCGGWRGRRAGAA